MANTETIGTATSKVPEFTGKAAEALTAFYTNAKVCEKNTSEKLGLLEANLGHFGFSAYGGEETDLMRLRAAERVYLFKQRIPVQ